MQCGIESSEQAAMPVELMTGASAEEDENSGRPMEEEGTGTPCTVGGAEENSSGGEDEDDDAAGTFWDSGKQVNVWAFNS